MWTCPKCGREFKRTNQGHFCGKAPETVDAYIAAQAPDVQSHISELRALIHRCVPNLKERIAWSMPYFEAGGCSISFSACKNHISLYLDAEILAAMEPQFNGFVIRKHAVYLPYGKVWPVSAIEQAITLFFAATGE